MLLLHKMLFFYKIVQKTGKLFGKVNRNIVDSSSLWDDEKVIKEKVSYYTLICILFNKKMNTIEF